MKYYRASWKLAWYFSPLRSCTSGGHITIWIWLTVERSWPLFLTSKTLVYLDTATKIVVLRSRTFYVHDSQEKLLECQFVFRLVAAIYCTMSAIHTCVRGPNQNDGTVVYRRFHNNQFWWRSFGKFLMLDCISSGEDWDSVSCDLCNQLACSYWHVLVT